MSHMQVRRNHPVAQRQDHLDQPRNAGSRFQVTDIGFHRANQARLAFRTVLHYRRQRTYFDWVAQDGTGTVRLDIAELLRRNPSVGKRRANHCLLGMAVGRRQSIAVAILVDGRASNERQDMIAGASRVAEALEHHDTAALAAHIPVGVGIEGLTAPIRRHHAGLRERNS
jgi:hypothetical protein